MGRVVQLVPERPLLAWCCAGALVSGFATTSEVWSVGARSYEPSWLRIMLPLTVALMLSLMTRRLRTIVLGTVLFGTVNLTVNWISAVAQCPFTNGAWLPWWESSLPSPLLAVVLLPAWAVMALVVRWLVARTSAAPIEQSGRLCWICSYELGDLARCPECGRDLNEQIPPVWSKWLAACLRYSRGALVVATCVVIGVAVFWVTTRTIPTSRFLRSIPNATFEPDCSWDTGWEAYGPGLSTPWGGSGETIQIAYFVTNEPSLPALQITMHWNVPDGETLLGTLTRAQTEWVIDHGFPREMLDDVVSHCRALRAQWGNPGPDRVNPEYLNASRFIPVE